MKTRLERLLGNIEPVPDRIDRVVDSALNTFPLATAIIADWDQYRQCLARFLCHVECTILGVPGRATNVDFDVDRCWHLLRKEYGASAPQAAFEAVRAGSEGGLRQVLRSVAELFSRDYAENLIGVAVEAYWSNRGPSAVLADAKEYIHRYDHILPGEISEGSAARIPANFRKVLKQHPFLIRRLCRTQSRYSRRPSPAVR